jgi:hypothetical protein
MKGKQLKNRSKHVKEVKCIVCETPYFRNTKGKSRQGAFMNNSTRGLNTITCSKECSKVYTRIFRYIKQNLTREKNRIKLKGGKSNEKKG